MESIIYTALLSLLSFIGMTLIYFLNRLNYQMQNQQIEIHSLRLDIELLKNTLTSKNI
jgi:hypothetical protein